MIIISRFDHVCIKTKSSFFEKKYLKACSVHLLGTQKEETSTNVASIRSVERNLVTSEGIKNQVLGSNTNALYQHLISFGQYELFSI